MAKKAEPTPSEYALAVADEIQLRLEAYGPPSMSGRGLAKLTGLSNSYVNLRLNGHAAFTLTDVSLIADALRVDLADIVEPAPFFNAKVTPIGVGVPRDLEKITRRAALRDPELNS